MGLFLTLEPPLPFNCNHFFRKHTNAFILQVPFLIECRSATPHLAHLGRVTPQQFLWNVQAAKKRHRVCLVLTQVSAVAHGGFKELGLLITALNHGRIIMFLHNPSRRPSIPSHYQNIRTSFTFDFNPSYKILLTRFKSLPVSDVFTCVSSYTPWLGYFLITCSKSRETELLQMTVICKSSLWSPWTHLEAKQALVF